jgi:hypothetical protein
MAQHGVRDGERQKLQHVSWNEDSTARWTGGREEILDGDLHETKEWPDVSLPRLDYQLPLPAVGTDGGGLKLTPFHDFPLSVKIP